MAGPLKHIRVLDLSRVLAGPWASQILADLGAEVIKIEKPGEGDDTRGWGPPFITNPDGSRGDAAYFLSTNRGKSSVLIDMSKPDGQKLIRELAAKSDVVLENFKVGGLKKYGLDYPSLAALNPQLIYCSITGFGQTGPYAERAGYDFIIQGMGGFMSVTGERDDLPGGGPQKAGVAISDLMTGMYACTAILAAVVHRQASDAGQYIDVSLLDSQIAMMAVMNMNYLVSGIPPGRAGNAHQNIVPYQVFACADGHLILAVGNDSQFARFCAVAGKSEWARDPRYAANAERVRRRDELIPLIAAVMRTRTQHDWLAALEAVGVPCGPINRLDQVFADPQVLAREMRLDLPHPFAGTVAQVGNPLHFSATPVTYTQAPPLLGEHTASVLAARLGLSREALADLAARGIVELHL